MSSKYAATKNRKTEQLLHSTAYLNHGEFSISCTEMQERKRVAAHTVWQGM